MKKIITWLGLMLFGVLVLPNSSLALGQMTEPIIIDNALRGEKIQQELIAVNSDRNEIDAIFTAEGDIKDWVKFYLSNDLNTEIDTFVLPAGGNAHIIAILEVPDDVENGTYLGSLSVSNVPSKDLAEGKSGSNVTQKIDRQINITVSDQEEVNIEKTSVIPNKFDLESGEPLSIRIIYNNQGNIRLSPQVRIKIKKDDKNIYDVIYPYPEDENEVNSKSQHEIKPIIIQTIGWETGKYFAFLEFNRNGETLLKKDFMFSVVDAVTENTVAERNMNNYIWIALLIGISLAVIVWKIRKR